MKMAATASKIAIFLLPTLCLTSGGHVLEDSNVPPLYTGGIVPHNFHGTRRLCVEIVCPPGSVPQICDPGRPDTTSCKSCDPDDFYMNHSVKSTRPLKCYNKQICSKNEGLTLLSNNDNKTDRFCRCMTENNYYQLNWFSEEHRRYVNPECYYCPQQDRYVHHNLGCTTCEGIIERRGNYKICINRIIARASTPMAPNITTQEDITPRQLDSKTDFSGKNESTAYQGTDVVSISKHKEENDNNETMLVVVSIVACLLGLALLLIVGYMKRKSIQGRCYPICEQNMMSTSITSVDMNSKFYDTIETRGLFETHQKTAQPGGGAFENREREADHLIGRGCERSESETNILIGRVQEKPEREIDNLIGAASDSSGSLSLDLRSENANLLGPDEQHPPPMNQDDPSQGTPQRVEPNIPNKDAGQSVYIQVHNNSAPVTIHCNQSANRETSARERTQTSDEDDNQSTDYDVQEVNDQQPPTTTRPVQEVGQTNAPSTHFPVQEESP